MTEEIKSLLVVVESLREKDLIDAKKIAELEMKIMKAERGNETLQERIKEKDAIIADYKDFVGVLRGAKKPESK